MKQIISFHMNQLGDLLFSLPVLKAIQNEMRDYEVFAVVKPSLAPLLTESGLASKIISKDKTLLKKVKIIRNTKSEKALLFSESPSMLITAYLSNIKERYGFKSASFSFFLTNKTLRNGVPSLANNILLGKNFGLKNIQKDYINIIKIPPSIEDIVNCWFETNLLDFKKTIAVSPGASKKRQDKCLDGRVWAEIIDKLSKKNLNCVLSGAKWEKENLNKIAKKCKSKPLIFTADGGILESAAFLKKCRLFIGIDSGAMHLAAAVGTKCIGIFGKTDPLQVGPMPLENHVIIKNENINSITSQDVLSEILKISL